MKLLMVSGERGIPAGKKSPLWHTLELLHTHFDRIDVLCPHASVAHPAVQPFENVFLHPSPRGLWYQPFWILHKGKELHAFHHHEVITTHEYPPFYNGIGAWRLAAATKAPLVVEYHDGPWCALTPRLATELCLLRLWMPFLARHAAALRVVNSGARDLFARWKIPAEKIKIVPSFYIDTSIWKPQEAAKTYDVVFCGRLAFTKGVEGILRALKDIGGATLAVVGDGPLRRPLERLSHRLGLEERVSFLGWLPTLQDVASVIRASKVFVLNSRIEGGPRVALEAMACGTPVISTKVGIMPDVIEHGRDGILIDPTVGALKEAIALLLKDDVLRQGLAAGAPAKVASFERSKAIERYAQFFQAICD
jgi:glycosyltransferase involved in cell wall biosynthesis